MDDYHNYAAHEALDRMRRAHDRGTGCRLTAEMIAALGLTSLAELWSDPNPTKEPKP